MDNFPKEYLNLLDIGRKKITGQLPNDLELSEDEPAIQELYQLNDYVYTYYSTNLDDSTFSIEFLFPTEKVKELLVLLEAHDFWYMCFTRKTTSCPKGLIEKIDKRRWNKKEEKEEVVYKEVKDRYASTWHMDEEQTKQLQTKFNRNDIFLYKQMQYIHFLNQSSRKNFIQPENIESRIKEYLREIQSPNMKPSNIKILSQNLSSIIIEDPRIGEDNLYRSLLPIVRRLMRPFIYSANSPNSPKSAKSYLIARSLPSKFTRTKSRSYRNKNSKTSRKIKSV